MKLKTIKEKKIMCGIIGIASNKPVSINIINSLKNWNIEDMTSRIATLKNNLINEKNG